MTNQKSSCKRIGQALGLLALSLALLAGSGGYGQVREQVDLPPVVFAIQLPPGSGPKGIAMAPATLDVRASFLAVATESGTLWWQLIAGKAHSSPGQPGHNGGIQMPTPGAAPHSVDVGEIAVAASATNSSSKEGPHSQIRAAQAQQQKVLRAFVGNFGSGDVTVVDIQVEGQTFEDLIAKLTVVETIKVGRQPTSLDFDPNSNKLYVNNFGSSSVSVIEVKPTGSQVVATITGFREPIFVKISPDGKRGYVSSQRRGEGVAVFGTATNTIIGRIDLPNVELRRLALSPDGTRLYVAVRTDILGTGQIAVIDTESLQVLQRYRTESFPLEIAVTPNGRCVFVTHSVPNRVSLMDVTDGQFAVAQDSTAREPQSVAIIENRAYVTNRLSDTISVFEFGEPCAEKKS